jgi:AcrR family transcriptional regulator
MPNPTPSLWERPERPTRPAPVPLTRDAIIKAALTLADAEGLSSVTLRKVGAALGAGPMRLYGFIETKEDLLALMVDAVYAEMLAGIPQAPPAWDHQVAALAHALRNAALQHPWFASLLGGRPSQGPNGLAFAEATLAAVARTPGLDGIDAIFQAMNVVIAYVFGAIRREAAERTAATESGMTKADWQDANWPYLQRMLATGRYPMLAKVVSDLDHPAPEVLFSRGLQQVLHGIARSPA